nr:MerR family DNA-binding transcriptional regulator [Planococcus glaciei]
MRRRKMISKEQPAYLSTGELSKLLNVSVRTIRYYDQIGLVEPSKKRGRRKTVLFQRKYPESAKNSLA